MSPSAVPQPNKFKAFFRSRSRSRPRPPSDRMQPDPDPLPHARKDSFSDNPPSSYPKSSARSQNRPVSSTTTATHSTITPLPSDALRNRMNRRRRAYAYQPQTTDTHTSLQDHDQCSDSCEYDSDDLRSQTPSSSSRKLVLPSFFGISWIRSSSTVSTPHQSISASDRQGSTSTSISETNTKSSRKRSFRLTSRPSTPKSVDESKSPYSIPVPSSPLPLSASPRRRSFGLVSSQRNTPKSSTTHLPLPHLQPGRSHGRRYSLGSERSPHDSAVALPEVLSHRNAHKATHPLPDGGSRNKGKEREKLFADTEKPLPDIHPSVGFSSQSLPSDPSSLSRNYPSVQLAGHSVSPHLSTVDSASEENEQPSIFASHPLPVIPRIIHTPPTPQRPGEFDSPSRPSARLPGADFNDKIETPRAKIATMPHREQVLVLSSQSHADAHQPVLSKGRFTPRFLSSKDPPKTKDQKSNKRSAAITDGPTQKTPVSSPVRSMTSHRSKLGSFAFERPVSALNKSSSTVDRGGTPAQKPSLHSLERTISNDSARGSKSRLHPGRAESPMLPHSKPDPNASVLSFSSVSLQTKSTGKGTANGSITPAGQSSSWGRASGRHVLRGSHGTFAFEHSSSVPNSPNFHTFNLPNGQNHNDFPGHTSGSPQPQPTSRLSNVFGSRVKHSRGQSYNTSVEPGYPIPDEPKPKGKGRSLDLGLGLSWAPSRLREEVLMPGFILSRDKAKQERKKANGLNVTKVFESLLSETQFQAFKKYVHRFDAHIIPLEGPTGLLARVEKLLAESGLSEREREILMTEFTAFVENHGE